MQSQNDQILAHLSSGAALTSLEAIELYGCTRLGGRSYDLRVQGHKIECELIAVPARGGRTAHVARYTIPRPAPVQLELI